jgi:hypothetical protein
MSDLNSRITANLGMTNEVHDGQDVADVSVNDRGVGVCECALGSAQLDDIILRETVRIDSNGRASHQGTIGL